MGGSSVPPGDLWRKFQKPTAQQLVAERRTRLLAIRNDLLDCQRCLKMWDVYPRFNQDRIETLLNTIRGRVAQEPDRQAREEQENFLLSPMRMFRRAFHRIQAHSEWRESALQAWEMLYAGYQHAWQAHRVRAGMPEKIVPTEFRDISSKEELVAYFEQLIEEDQLRHLHEYAYNSLRGRLEAVGIYIPPQRLVHKRYYKPSMFFLFGFLPPFSTAEEVGLYHSPLLKYRYKQLLMRYHPDTMSISERPKIARYWFPIVHQTYQRLMARKRMFATGFLYILEDEVYNTRTPEEMMWNETSINRGYALPEASTPIDRSEE